MATRINIILYAIIFILSSCQRTSIPVGDTSRNALDWAGTYHGILPCADCPGILTMIQINADNTFTMSTSYLGRGGTEQKKTGSFSWDDAGSEITLKGLGDSTPPVYKVGENKLIPVHPSITNSRVDQYTLTRNGNEITNRYWRLVQVNDRAVTPHDNQRKEAHLILLSTDRSVIGNGSCNGFKGTYDLTADNGISFSPLAATKMACMENMDVENQMLKALAEVSSYKVSGDSLFLLNDLATESATFVTGNFN